MCRRFSLFRVRMGVFVSLLPYHISCDSKQKPDVSHLGTFNRVLKRVLSCIGSLLQDIVGDNRITLFFERTADNTSACKQVCKYHLGRLFNFVVQLKRFIYRCLQEINQGIFGSDIVHIILLFADFSVKYHLRSSNKHCRLHYCLQQILQQTNYLQIVCFPTKRVRRLL